MERHRRTTINIDLNALVHNFQWLKKQTQKEICCVVKADAYGHGSVPCALTLQKAGAQWFATALIEEAVELRKQGITGHILVLSGAARNNAQAVKSVEEGLISVIWNIEQIKILESAALSLKKPAKIHLKLNTGMNRLGANLNEAAEIVDYVNNKSLNIEWSGIMSHLACADEHHRNGVAEQKKSFYKFLNQYHHNSLKWIHISNSADTMHFIDNNKNESEVSNLMRTGLVLFGIDSREIKQNLKQQIKPVLSWQTEIIHIRTLSPGDALSYGWSYVAEQSERIGVLPVGYADGYSRKLSNQGHVLINGEECAIIGRVCMDLTMVRLTDLKKPVEVGDQVTLLGTNGGKELTAGQMSQWCETIPYEVVCTVGARVPRNYLF